MTKSHSCAPFLFWKGEAQKMTEKETKRAKGLLSPEEVRAKETLSPEEVAVVLGCGRTTAYRILASSEISSFRIGQRLRRVRRVDVERYMAPRIRVEGEDTRYPSNVQKG